MTLKEKAKKQYELTKQLEKSLALEKALPGIFDHGSVKVGLFSNGVQGQPFVRIRNTQDDILLEKPLIEMPEGLIQIFSGTIYQMKYFFGRHKDWKKLRKIIKHPTKE